MRSLLSVIIVSGVAAYPPTSTTAYPTMSTMDSARTAQSTETMSGTSIRGAQRANAVVETISGHPQPVQCRQS